MRGLAAVVLTGITVIFVIGGVASAGGVTAGGYTNGTGGGVRVESPGSQADPGASGPRASSGQRCGYFEVLPGDPPYAGGHISDTSILELGVAVLLQCVDRSTGALVSSQVVFWDPATAVETGPTAVELAEIAANSVQLPAPSARTWPAGGSGLVNLPVWLHVENWVPLSASASAGGLTATVEAVPVRAIWRLGSDTVVCRDAGTEWAPSADVTAPSCSYTFRRSSGGQPDGRFPASVSVVWQLRWSATDGEVGDLGELTSPASSFGLRIEESQALVAPGRN